jgi:hypothetical protein
MLESGLVKRAQERQLIFGQAWADVMVMAYKLERTFGAMTMPEIEPLGVQTMWSDPEIRNELSESQSAEIHKRLGVPDEAIWAKLGYSPQQIARFKAMQRNEQAEAVATVAQAMRRQQQRQQQAFEVARQNGANGQGTQP